MPGTPRNSTLPRSSKPVPRAGDHVTDGAGDEDFAGRGLAENPRCDVHCDSSDVGIQRVRARRCGCQSGSQCLMSRRRISR